MLRKGFQNFRALYVAGVHLGNCRIQSFPNLMAYEFSRTLSLLSCTYTRQKSDLSTKSLSHLREIE